MYSNLKFNNEDLAVIGKVLATLGELGITLLLRDPVPVMWDYGPHRLYQWQITTSKTAHFDIEIFQMLLNALNNAGKYNPQLYSIESYPSEQKGYTHHYLTVYI